MQAPAQRELATARYAVQTRCRRFEGQAAIVTGAAQGLGRVIATRLAEEGAEVLIADLNAAQLARTRQAIADKAAAKIEIFVGDLSKPAVAEQMVAAAVAAFGRVDVLVNNAAALIRLPLVEMSEELMQAAVDGNVWTTLRCCKAVLPPMLKQRYGRIVNIGGEAWRTGAPCHTLLAGVGKGSMVGLTATLAGETVRDGITVNCVSPAGLESEADGRAPDEPPALRNPAWTPQHVLDGIRQRTTGAPIGRLAHPSEVAAAVAFFASYEASFVTGQHLGVSGGYAML